MPGGQYTGSKVIGRRQVAAASFLGLSGGTNMADVMAFSQLRQPHIMTKVLWI